MAGCPSRLPCKGTHEADSDSLGAGYPLVTGETGLFHGAELRANLLSVRLIPKFLVQESGTKIVSLRLSDTSSVIKAYFPLPLAAESAEQPNVRQEAPFKT